MTQILLLALGIILIYYLFVLVQDVIQHLNILRKGKILLAIPIGFVTDFFDTLGIGSFAPTTLLFRATNFLDSDRDLPGTLNIAHTIPTMLETYIFIKVVKVEPLTLFSLVAAAVLGSWVASKRVVTFSEEKIHTIIGISLVVTAILMAVRHLGLIDLLGQGNEASGLSGVALVIGIVGNFILGCLMTIGVGLYAPCMALLYFLGLSPLMAFPIMMASCAGIMPVAGAEFIRKGHYSREAVLGIIIGGVVGVVIATEFVTNLNIEMLTWLVIIVIGYSGISTIRKQLKKHQTTKPAE